MIHFHVPGAAAPQGSKNAIPVRNKKTGQIVAINQVESSKAVKPWRERVAVFAHNAMAGRPPIVGAVAVAIIFDIPRPKSAPKRRYATTQPDVDKLARAVLDAMTGIVLRDDSLVVSLNARKHLVPCDAAAGARISVVELEPAIPENATAAEAVEANLQASMRYTAEQILGPIPSFWGEKPDIYPSVSDITQVRR